MAGKQDWMQPTDIFVERHIGPSAVEQQQMLATLEFTSLESLVDAAVPEAIRTQRPLQIDPPESEHVLLARLRDLATRNQVFRSYLGMGYHDTITPPVIQRNILENPGWYTQYTPYQAEIAQGRLEALLNFQTMVADLTQLPVANASLLDEATAAAEAMNMCRNVSARERNTFFVAADCHPQTIAVVQTRAAALGVDVVVGDPLRADFASLGGDNLFGALLQYPRTDGAIIDYSDVIERIHQAGGLAVVATDLLALTLLTPPGAMGADVAVGASQRFGVPLGYGGPHAAFMATTEKYTRRIPGRIVGVSRDARGQTALRLAMQTREQHIRRERATSNICTAQVLLAVMASMYAVYHGPDGLRRIARRIRGWALTLAAGLREKGFALGDAPFFDTVRVELGDAVDAVLARAQKKGINLRKLNANAVTVALDETVEARDIADLLEVFGGAEVDVERLAAGVTPEFQGRLARTSSFLTHSVFNSHHSETEMLRYIHQLETRDLSLNTSMIPLGSCTMKLNGTSEMLPLSWAELARMHPFAPPEQAQGYREMFADLEAMIAEMTGFHRVSLQPNAGSQGEYAGLLTIRAYHRDRDAGHRNVCLIPASAHGTNPASAVMAGMKVVVVDCDDAGNIDLQDLRTKADKHAERLAALMITYPSTHGVFEETVKDVCRSMHERGALVYMDGANLNAQVGVVRPAELGADVCHLNLHKTFAIPHGGGGPGMGPIAVAEHLAPYLPGHPVVSTGGEKAIGPIAATPWGSPSILAISWMYMKLMGGSGLKDATRVAILNANYMAKRLESHYPILYRGQRGQVAHEFIIDLRPFKNSANVTVDDVAKRLIDFDYHAPTMSWPVMSTMMIEPTESESKAELDRFCDAMITIRAEIRAIEEGKLDAEDNPLKNAPHTAEMVADTEWTHPYPREQGAYPARHLRSFKYWAPVARVDNTYGDRNFACTCPPLDAYTER